MSKKQFGKIIHRDGYTVTLLQEGDKTLRREELPYQQDKEDSSLISYPHSRYDEINRFSLYSYCSEYFGRSPEDCQNLIRIV